MNNRKGVMTIAFAICVSLLATSNRVFANDLSLMMDTVEVIGAATEQADKQEKDPFSLSGYFDTYYFTNLNNPSTRNNLGSSGISRGFDRYVDQFQLGMLMMRMSYTTSKLEFVGEIGYGPNVEYGSYGNDFRYKWGNVLANSTYTALMIKQAYISYKIIDKLTVTAGQFGTHIGYEYIDAPLNYHYSINNTFNAGIPFYHNGLKATYAFNDHFTLMAGVVNGTDNSNDNNRGKSFIGQFVVTPSDKFNFSINTIHGNEANARTNGKDTSSYFGVWDFVASYQVSKKVKLGLWAMLGSARGEFQGGSYAASTKDWSGVNVYAVYNFSPTISLGTRLEYFNNAAGARPLLTHGKGTDVKTLTITGNISLAEDRLLLKPEFRFDQFKKIGDAGKTENMQQFMDSEGKFSKNTQSTFGMAVIVKFDAKK